VDFLDAVSGALYQKGFKQEDPPTGLNREIELPHHDRGG